jgi:hypothetical protein
LSIAGALSCNCHGRGLNLKPIVDQVQAFDLIGPDGEVHIGTDRSRLDVVSDRFIDAFNRSPLATDGALRKSRGYAATPLTGVWANYPYLHNGSVPTLHDLLGPTAERPKIFDVRAARTLDRVRIGQPLYLDPDDARLGQAELIRRFGDNRDWFNAARPGCANGGHDFWRQIRTAGPAAAQHQAFGGPYPRSSTAEQAPGCRSEGVAY